MTSSVSIVLRLQACLESSSLHVTHYGSDLHNHRSLRSGGLFGATCSRDPWRRICVTKCVTRERCHADSPSVAAMPGEVNCARDAIAGLARSTRRKTVVARRVPDIEGGGNGPTALVPVPSSHSGPPRRACSGAAQCTASWEARPILGPDENQSGSSLTRQRRCSAPGGAVPPASLEPTCWSRSSPGPSRWRRRTRQPLARRAVPWGRGCTAA